MRDIAAALEAADDAALVVIDSIQTMWMDSIDSAPGTVSQVRACSFELIRLAKSRGFALVLVGHVTKDGAIAGPRVLEHMVDAVLYFEGDRGHQFRILRGVKNRFGATDEIGVFAMTEQGWRRSPTRPRCSWRSGAATSPAPRCSPGWRARAPCWWRCRRCCRPTPAGRRGAR